MVVDRKFVIISLLLSFFCGALIHYSASAKSCSSTCNSVSRSENPSLYRACHECEYGNNSCGALWINDSSDACDISTTVDAGERTSGTVNYYLHGTTIDHGVFASSYAEEICLLEGSSNVYGTWYINHCNQFDIFESAPDWVYRPGSGNGDSLLNIDSSSAYKIDVGKVDRTKYCTASGGYLYCSIPVQIFRCYGSNRSDDSCYSDTSWFDIKIKNTVKLNAWAVTDGDTILNSGRQIGGAPKEVTVGNNASVTTGSEIGNNVFLGWKVAKSHSSAGCKELSSKSFISRELSYSEKISDNKTICAIYAEPSTFTAYHKDQNRKIIKPEYEATIKYGYTASYTRPAITGYTFNGWSANGDCAGRVNTSKPYLDSTAYPPSCIPPTNTKNKGYWLNDSKTTYNYMNMTNDVGVNAFYTKNTYQGRARVAEGDNWKDSTNTSSYGYSSSDGSTETIKIQCANDNGCKATFFFDLKETHGYSAATKYCIQARNADGTWPNECTPIYSSGNVKNGEEVDKVTKNIKIDETVCYRMVYNHTTTSEPITRKVSACAYVVPTLFQGKTVLSGGAGQTAGYTDKDNPKSISKIASIDKCSSKTGCKVTFKHYLKRPQGIASTTYSITRTSNLTDSERGISAGTIISERKFDTDKETLVSESSDLTLYPGMVVCERMTFRPNNKSGTTNIYTQICVRAYGDSQPENPPDKPEDPNKDPLSGDSAFINIKVKNPSTTNYKNYMREVYAKPNDVVTYRAVYNPILQYTYYLKPEKMQIDGGTVYPAGGKNQTCKLGQVIGCSLNGRSITNSLFNYYKNSGTNNGRGLKNWNNDFSVQRAQDGGFDGNNVSLVGNYNFTNGNMALQFNNNTYTILPGEVGHSVDEKVITNLNGNTQTTPSQVVFTNSSDLNLGNVITDSVSKIAYVRVPYNFTNTTSVLGRDGDKDYVFAGESATISFKIDTNTKRNNHTNGTYATIVRDAKWKLEICFNNNTTCRESTPSKTAGTIGDLNSSGSTGGYSETKTITLNIPDVPAGDDKVCFRSAVYPSDSDKSPSHEVGKNWNDKEGSHDWAWSDRKCFDVAKKPSLQVWGGNVYSRGRITTATSTKRVLDGYTNYLFSGTENGNYVFGSWGELGVVSASGVNGFASGATTGFATNTNGVLWPNYTFGNNYVGRGNNSSISSHAKTETGGNKENAASMCNRVPLSFANAPCTGSVAPPIGNSISSNSGDNDKSNIIRKLILGGDVNMGDSITVSDDTPEYNYAGNKAIRVLGTGNLTGGVKTIHSTNTITITGNLVYNGTYRSIAGIPKIVIYGKNIVIDCNVSRIDAILIADENVKTCNSDNINARANSNQLIINGAIISNSLTPNRTYGASSGANSIIPAEIINYDPSLYLWGGADTNYDVGSTTNLDVTYLHELSPRY